MKAPIALRRLLEEKELEEFLKAVARDKVIVPTLLKILEQKMVEVDRRDNLLDHPNYPYKRAYLDGRLKDLGWFYKLLTLEEEAQTNERNSTGTGS